MSGQLAKENRRIGDDDNGDNGDGFGKTAAVEEEVGVEELTVSAVVVETKIEVFELEDL